MRVPLIWAILLSFTVVGGVWFVGVRKKDFLTPPSDGELAAIRAEVSARFALEEPTVEVESPAVIEAPVVNPVVVETEKQIDLGDLTSAPELSMYAERAVGGAEHLIDLARALEDGGHFSRALLAWERVIDMTRPDGEQATAAISAIRRIHPTLPSWNPDPTQAISIKLHAGTGKSMAKVLAPVLEAVAGELTVASSGIIRFSARVAAGKTDLSANGPTPVALWLAGPGKDANTTEVLSFTVESEEHLRTDVLKIVFQLMRGYLNQTTSYTTPAALGASEDPLEALSFRFSRLCWSEFGRSLSLPPAEASTPPKKP